MWFNEGKRGERRERGNEREMREKVGSTVPRGVHISI